MDIANMPQCSIFIIFISTNAKFFAATKKVYLEDLPMLLTRSDCERKISIISINMYQAIQAQLARKHQHKRSDFRVTVAGCRAAAFRVS